MPDLYLVKQITKNVFYVLVLDFTIFMTLRLQRKSNDTLISLNVFIVNITNREMNEVVVLQGSILSPNTISVVK